MKHCTVKYNACKLGFEGKCECEMWAGHVFMRFTQSLKWPIDANWKILTVISKERIKRVS